MKHRFFDAAATLILSVMKKYFSLSFILWLLAALGFAVAFFLYYFSSQHTTITLTLNEGETVEAHVFRPLPYRAEGMELWFRHDLGQARPELGTWAGQREQGKMVFADAGAPLQLAIAMNHGDFEAHNALPASGFGQNTIPRQLVCAQAMTDAVTFNPDAACIKDHAAEYAAGLTAVTIKVLQVDESLRGERVQLIMRPPLGFSEGQENGLYGWLWLMYFYPIYLVILLLWLVVLLVKTSRRSVDEAQAKKE
ncbi:MAG: hypothetical protein Q4G42_04850 [Neisseria sp.]|nr:hypothetical protein [Neisseria sp.]